MAPGSGPTASTRFALEQSIPQVDVALTSMNVSLHSVDERQTSFFVALTPVVMPEVVNMLRNISQEAHGVVCSGVGVRQVPTDMTYDNLAAIIVDQIMN
jgi:hypothetical protein